MKRAALVLVLVLTQAGCLMPHTMPNGKVERVFALQVGANVQVLDFCGESGVVYPSHGYIDDVIANGVRTLPGRPTWIAAPLANGLSEYAVSMTYGEIRNGELVGAVSRSFPVNRHQGSQRFQWVLTPDGSWGGGGGSNLYIDRCPGARR